jgi:hypothetical protein
MCSLSEEILKALEHPVRGFISDIINTDGGFMFAERLQFFSICAGLTPKLRSVKRWTDSMAALQAAVFACLSRLQYRILIFI